MSKPPITVKVIGFLSEKIACSIAKDERFWPLSSIDAIGNGTVTIHFEPPQNYREFTDGRRELTVVKSQVARSPVAEMRLIYPNWSTYSAEEAALFRDGPLVWRSNEAPLVVAESYATAFGTVSVQGRALTLGERQSVEQPKEQG